MFLQLVDICVWCMENTEAHVSVAFMPVCCARKYAIWSSVSVPMPWVTHAGITHSAPRCTLTACPHCCRVPFHSIPKVPGISNVSQSKMGLNIALKGLWSLILSLFASVSLSLSLSHTHFQSSFCFTSFISSLFFSPVSIGVIYSSSILASLPVSPSFFVFVSTLFPSFSSVSVLLSSQWLEKVDEEALFPHQIKNSHGLY